MFWKLPRIEKIFLIITLFFGFLFVFVNPPFQFPDEPEHLFKMYGYTRGTLKYQVLNGNTGLYLPKSFVKLKNMYANLPFNYFSSTSLSHLKCASQIQLEEENKVFYKHSSTSYLPISYFPTFIWLKILLLFNTPPLIMLFLLRLSELFLYTGLMWLAIRITPVKKELFALLAMLPMALYMGCSINTDPLVMGLSFVFSAYIFKLACDSKIERISFGQILLSAFMMFVITLCKLAYIPLLLLFFLIPYKKFRSVFSYLGSFSLIFCLSCVAFGLFVLYGFHSFGGGLVVSSGIEAAGEQGGSNYLVHIMTHPLYYLKNINSSFFVLYKDIMTCFVGRFGWLDTFIPPYLAKFYWCVIFLVAFLKNREEENGSFSLSNKLVLFLIFYLSYVLISLSGFLTFKQLTPYILGIQGRYFIPIAPAFLSILSFSLIKISSVNLTKFIFITSLVGLSVSLYFLILRFYMTFYVQLWY